MKKITLLFLVAITMIPTLRLQAQVRPDIYSFTSAERTMLVNAMMEYIDAEVVQKHCVHQMTTGGGIHSHFDFLPFHRTYLEKMEDYLLSKGGAYHIFVPLPKWDPCTWTPPEFQVIDPDCGTFTCDMDTPAVCANIPNWYPLGVNSNVVLPYYLSLPVQSGNYNDLCDWDMYPVHPADPLTPPCCNSLSGAIGTVAPVLTGFPIFIPQVWHTAIHQNMSGVMGGECVLLSFLYFGFFTLL